MIDALLEQPREDSHQRPLFVDGQASEGRRRRGHAVEQDGAEARTRRREIQHLDTAVGGRRAPAHEPARFEPIHEARHVGRVAGERLGELTHRDRSAGLDQVQHMALRRRELKFGGEWRQVRPLGEEEPREELPCVAGVGARAWRLGPPRGRAFHIQQYSSFHQ